MENNTILSLKNISKVYPGVVALKDVSVAFKRGEVHAIAGENGAGKSTLMKIISGAVKPTEGSLIINGTEHRFMTTELSRSQGIAIIYQEFTLIPALSVAENIFLGTKQNSKVFIHKAEMERRSKEIFQSLGIALNPKAKIRSLSVAHQQMVEIAKALSQNAKILIMDEPSAPLTKNEVDIMLSLVKKLKESGVTIIYISHRLDELFEISDRITVLRDGQFIKTLETKNTSKQELIHDMVGRYLTQSFETRNTAMEEIAFEARNVSGNGVSDISLYVRKGEVLGLAGLVGAGRTEFSEVAFGKEKLQQGQFFLYGKEVKITSPYQAIKLGIGLVPEDRKRNGVLLEHSVRDNIILPSLAYLSTGLVISAKKSQAMVRAQIDALHIKTPSVMQKAKNLSGGNQQKVVLAKWLAARCDILIIDEPTRGIDVGAKQEIYNLIAALASQGKSIIVISSEMEEILGISDRIVILHEGRMAGELSREQFSQDLVMAIASGEKVNLGEQK